MANLTSPAQRIFFHPSSIIETVLTLGSTVWAGAAVEHNAGAGQNLTGAGTHFVGFALQSGVSGDQIAVAMEGIVELTVAKASNFDSSEIDNFVYGSDGNAFTLVSASNQVIGKVLRVVSGVGTTSAVCLVKFQGVLARSI